MLATASAIVQAGGIPIPVDIGHDNLIDPDSIENSITDKTVWWWYTHSHIQGHRYTG